MFEAREELPPWALPLAARAFGVVAVVGFLYVAGDATVSTAPAALLAAAFGLVVGAVLQLVTDRSAARGRAGEARRADRLSNGLLIAAAAGGAVLALTYALGPTVRSNPAVLYQFLVGALCGGLGVQVAAVAVVVRADDAD